ncbi:MAG: GlmU family protein [Flavobacteriaceae bacterium]|nr:GlmU family protein [Flavobacteriaceae bacterium]
MSYILFDSDNRENLLPLTFLKPVAHLLVGLINIQEKWNKHLNTQTKTHTQQYLNQLFPCKKEEINTWIDASVLPTVQLVNEVKNLDINSVLLSEENNIIAYKSENKDIDIESFNKVISTENIKQINYTHDIFTLNDWAIKQDFELLTKGRKSEKLSETNNVLGLENIFLEEGVEVEFATLNAKTGPIYLAKNSQIMEGAIIRGPFGLSENAVVKMGAKIYGATTIGKGSKVGGEVSNSIISDNSNKGHDGFLGNSVIGEWCNLGADTNNSNLKNNYAPVKLWSYKTERFEKTGLQFCGLIMGDHSKCGINTMFNTGTVVGVSCNIYGSDFLRNYIPSFSWGSSKGFIDYKFEKAIETIKAVYARRSKDISELEIDVLREIKG